jgi:hypothetical protein
VGRRRTRLLHVLLDSPQLARARADLARSWRAALAFHVLAQAAGLAVVTPLATWAGRRLVARSGDPVVTNFDLASFALSPAGAAFVLLVAALTIGFLLAELAGFTWLAGHAIGGRRATLGSTLAAVARRLHRLVMLAARCWSSACSARCTPCSRCGCWPAGCTRSRSSCSSSRAPAARWRTARG